MITVMSKAANLEWTPEYLEQCHRNSVDIAKKYNLDVSKETIIASLADAGFAYDRESWLMDVKLSHFVPLAEGLKTDGNWQKYEKRLLRCALGSRSASIGAVRGDRLNKLVATICKVEGWEVETEVKKDVVTEKIDVVARNRANGDEINFMVQVDLWGGGAQQNRATNYLSNENIVCVVYNQYKPPGNRAKQAKQRERLLFGAHKEDRLIWIGQLPHFLERRL